MSLQCHKGTVMTFQSGRLVSLMLHRILKHIVFSAFKLQFWYRRGVECLRGTEGITNPTTEDPRSTNLEVNSLWGRARQNRKESLPYSPVVPPFYSPHMKSNYLHSKIIWSNWNIINNHLWYPHSYWPNQFSAKTWSSFTKAVQQEENNDLRNI